MINDYFQTYQLYFWEWQLHPEKVVAIQGSNTIAYVEFLQQVVDRLAPQGLPPAGALMLAIAATGPQDNSWEIDHIEGLMMKRGDQIGTTLTQAIKFMRVLNSLPPEYKKGDKRMMVLQAIFENCHNRLSLNNSKTIGIEFRQGLLDFEKVTNAKPFSKAIFTRDFRTLEIALVRMPTAEAILDKIASLPDTTQLELDLAETPDQTGEPVDFIETLIGNYKTFHSASLIRWLWGGLNIPVHSTLPSQQPLGGISDLTNKGNFDKLLISEFAYDDITFLSRLANNEALYIHREVPPASNDLHRIILIDTSIKNWGTPKTIAFAIMLAVAHHPKTDITCEAYALSSSGYVPIKTDTLNGIIDGLQIIDGSLHAGNSLQAFLDDHGKDANKEIILVTESTTWRHPAMLKVLHDHHNLINYHVLTDADGNVELYKRQQGARKHVQHLKLPLEELWKQQRTKTTEAEPTPKVNDLVPLLIRDAGMPRRIVDSPDKCIFMLTSEYTILKQVNPKSNIKGWAIQFENTVKSNIFEMGMTPNGDYVALLFDVPKREIQLIDLSTRVSTKFSFKEWRSTAWPSFIFEDGRFHHHNYKGTWSIELNGSISTSSLTNHSFLNRQRDLEGIEKKGVPHRTTVLKNINRVFINSKSQLVFNHHTLHFDHHFMRFVGADDIHPKIEAKKTTRNQFTFPNGSIVESSRTGYLILRDSNAALESIFIPTMLDTIIAIATPSTISGDKDFFHDYDRYRVTITNVDPKYKLHVTKYLVSNCKLSLHTATQLLSSLPSKLPGNFTAEESARLRGELVQLNAQVDVAQATPGQTELGIGDFSTQFYLPFINRITNHGR